MSADHSIAMPGSSDAPPLGVVGGAGGGLGIEGQGMANAPTAPPAKKSRTNTPWTAAEEQRLKAMRDTGSSWADIAKVCNETFEKAAAIGAVS